MFRKYTFRVRGNFILTTKFGVDPSKFHPAETSTWSYIVATSYQNSLNPTDAACLFMLSRISILPPGKRDPHLVEPIIAVLDCLKEEISTRGNIELRLEAQRLEAETQGHIPHVPGFHGLKSLR